MTLRQSWPIKFVTANRVVRAERNGKCAARARRCVYSRGEGGRARAGPLRDGAAGPICSAAHAHMWTQAATPTGLLRRAFNCAVHDEAASEKEKKEKSNTEQAISALHTVDEVAAQLSCDGRLRRPSGSAVKLTYTTDCQQTRGNWG